jgi:hypothetical protein
MRQVLIIALVFFFFLDSSGQIRDIKVPQVMNSGTIIVSVPGAGIKVTDTDNNVYVSKPAYYLNGELVSEHTLRTLNPAIIEDIRIEKQNITIKNDKYYGQVFVKTKSDYKLQLISLTDLKLKYTDLKKGFAIFMIDNEIINYNAGNLLIDENNILSISIEKIENRNERHKINFVKILTRTEENIRKSKEIRIRGSEEI